MTDVKLLRPDRHTVAQGATPADGAHAGAPSVHKRKPEEEGIEAGASTDEAIEVSTAAGSAGMGGTVAAVAAGVGAMAVAAFGGDGKDSDPGHVDQQRPDPISPQPTHPEAVTPQPGPSQPDPIQPAPVTPEGTNPHPTTPDPVKPDTATPETPKPDTTPSEPTTPTEPEQPPRPAGPTLALKEDTGRSDSDHITNKGTVTVGGLQEGAAWSYSLDGGQTWKEGSGNEIAASEFGADGHKTVLAKQMLDATTESAVSTLAFDLDTVAGTVRWALKSHDSLDQLDRPITSNPTLVFDGAEDGASLTWIMYGGPALERVPQSLVFSESSSEFVLSLQPGFYYGFDLKQVDVAGNVSAFTSIDGFNVVAPDPSQHAQLPIASNSPIG